MNTELKKGAKNYFHRDFFKFMNNAFKKKTWKKWENSKILKKINCHTTRFFTETFWGIEMWKTQILMNKPVYVGLSR